MINLKGACWLATVPKNKMRKSRRGGGVLVFDVLIFVGSVLWMGMYVGC